MKTTYYKMSVIIAALFLFTSCNKEYKRSEGCNLDKMSIKGNVIKVETIVQSTIPLTEIFYKSFDPQNALFLYSGNTEVEFDYNGNVKHSIGYGMNGEVLYDIKPFKNKDKDETNLTPCVSIGPGAKETIDKIKTVSNESGNIVEVKYYDRDKLIWTQRALYNDDGSLNYITKEYETMKLETDFIHISYSDTTNFKYLSYDEHNNWTEAEVDYKGVLPKHKHSYKIKRQITYVGESKKPLLINQLKSYNKCETETTSQFDSINMGHYGKIKIPHYMAIQPKSYINEVENSIPLDFHSKLIYLIMTVYDNNDAYATFSVNVSQNDGSGTYDELSSNELAYNKETDQYMEEFNTQMMEKGNVYILKWLPYSFVDISIHKALKIRYYRYGIGSPIPVYCENYTIPMPDGNVINIIYSFQSNLDYKFRSDFEKAINSITFFR